jgi:uncharacterized protein YbbC (DUF1343 family)
VNSQLTSTVEIFQQHPEINLVTLFGPEHGIRGEAQAGEKVTSYIDPETGLTVHSLYGETKKPTDAMLEGLDTLVYDIQDVGVRYYTYISTMCYAMEKAAEKGLKFIVLDRPNLVRGDVVDGNLLNPAFSSFIGLYPIPIRYGMTLGELALLVNQEFGIGADLTVVPMEGWRRSDWFEDTGLPWLAPSMGIPTPETAVLYTGMCFVEGTNFSEGRGTTQPFQLFGAPWVHGRQLADALNTLQLPGVYFRPTYFKPTTSKHQGELCGGAQVHLLNRNAFQGSQVGLAVLQTLKRLYPEEFGWFTFTKDGVTKHFIDLLWGTDAVRHRIDAGEGCEDLLAQWEKERADFAQTRQQYLLYK